MKERKRKRIKRIKRSLKEEVVKTLCLEIDSVPCELMVLVHKALSVGAELLPVAVQTHELSSATTVSLPRYMLDHVLMSGLVCQNTGKALTHSQLIIE